MLREFNGKIAIPTIGAALSVTGLAQGATPLPNTKPEVPVAETSPKISVNRENTEGFTFYKIENLDFSKLSTPPRFGDFKEVVANPEGDSSAASLSIGSLADGKSSKNLATEKEPSANSISGVSSLLPAGLLGIFRRRKERSNDTSSSTNTSGTGPSPNEWEETNSETEGLKSESGIMERYPALRIASNLWKLWEKPCEMIPSPWRTVVKYGVPVIAATCGVVWFGTVVQVAAIGIQMFGDVLAPFAGAAAFLAPMVAANPILKGIEKLFHLEPTKGWRREAILRPAQAALLIGAGCWTHALDLTPFSYAGWTAGAAACGWLANKILPKASKQVWTSVITAIALPWTHLATMRSFDVTVKGAGPDPEVGAWNVTTDLSKGDHWKSVALPFLSKPKAPSGGTGMVLLNRDVPLFLPPHRDANSFNGEFTNLIGKQVRVTTVGTWLKPLSAKLQPTIVKYKVLEKQIQPEPPSSK